MKDFNIIIAKKILTITEFIAASSVLSVVVGFVDKYVFSDWEFIFTLVVLIVLDTVLGFYLAWKRKEVSSDGFAKLFKKLIVYIVLLICSHTAATVKANGSEIIMLNWLDSVIYSGIIVREILSLFEKCAVIQPNLVPQWILERLRNYNEKGENKE
jgi:toxin secretion/phage lysis holin